MTFSFETAYERLEKILQQLNSGETPLEESLKLYEEADTLITTCNALIQTAEKKMEILIKKRNGEIAVDEKDAPKLQKFTPHNDRMISRELEKS